MVLMERMTRSDVDIPQNVAVREEESFFIPYMLGYAQKPTSGH